MLPTTKLLRLPYLFIILSLSVSSAIAQVEDYRLWISRNAGGNGYGEIASINADGSAYDAGYVFPGNTDGTEANGLIMANDGQLYGTTRLGGKFNRGTLFRLSPDGSTFEVLINISAELGSDIRELMQGDGEILYAVVTHSGRHRLLAYHPDSGDLDIAYEFSEAETGYNIRIAQGSDGLIYGTITNSSFDGSRLFKIDPATGSYDLIRTFTQTNLGTPLRASDGNLYFTAEGADELGTNGAAIRRVSVDGTSSTVVFDISSSTSNPLFRKLTEDSDAYLYGAANPGVYGVVVFRVLKDGTDYSVLHTFAYGEARSTFNLEFRPDGWLYGLAQRADNSNFLYRLKSDGSEFTIIDESSPATGTEEDFFAVKHSFSANESIERLSSHGEKTTLKELPRNDVGPMNVFPMATGGLVGKIDKGLFSLTTEGKHTYKKLAESALYEEGSGAYGPVSDQQGNLYLQWSGPDHIIRISPDGTRTVIHEFDPPAYANRPTGKLFLASDGYLYGINVAGGVDDKPRMFRIKTDGTDFSTQHTFDDYEYLLRQRIAFEHEGYLYGVWKGGANNGGYVYRFSPATHTFENILDLNHGIIMFEYLRMMKGSDNMIYITATTGGAGGKGIIFRFAPDGSGYQVVREFIDSMPEQEFFPRQTVEGPDGKLYGLTMGGGSQSAGVLFVMDKDGDNFQIVHRFPYNPNGLFIAEMEMFFVRKNDHTITFALDDEFVCGGPAVTLSASSDMDLPVNFRSSDPFIAIVEGSTLKLVAAGEATIFAEQLSNPFYTRSAVAQLITVGKGTQIIPDAEVEPIVVPAQTGTDAIVTLPATTNSGLPITYTAVTDNITVDGNEITILAAGRAVVAAEQPGNENYLPAARVQIEFCVNAPRPVIIHDPIAGASVLLRSSNEAGNQWFRNDEPIAGANLNSLEISDAGVYAVQTTIEGCQSEKSEDYVYTITGIADIETAFQIYPNHVTDVLVIEKTRDYDSRIDVSVINLSGKEVFAASSDGERQSCDLTHLQNGLYIVRIKSGEALFRVKIVKR